MLLLFIGFTLSYKRNFGEWEDVAVTTAQPTYTLSDLHCGSKYQLYLTAFNRMGAGEPSSVVAASTEGSGNDCLYNNPPKAIPEIFAKNMCKLKIYVYHI